MRAPQSPAFVETDTTFEGLLGTAVDPLPQQDGFASVLGNAREMLAEEKTSTADLRAAGSFASVFDTKGHKTEMSDKIDQFKSHLFMI